MNLSDFDISYLCRGCLSVGLDMTNLAEDEETLLMFNVCTQLKVHENEDLPLFLCDCCIKQCESWLSFKIQCEESEMELRKRLSEPSNCKEDEYDTSLPESVELEFLDDSSVIEMINVVEPEKTDETEKALTLETDVEDVDQNIEPFNAIVVSAASVPTENAVSPTDNKLRAALQTDNDSDTEICNTIVGNATNANADKHIIKCHLCGQPSRNRVMLTQHIRQAHRTKPLRSFKCTECDRIYNNPKNLEEHYVQRHGGKGRFICEYCAKPFYNIYNLNIHMVKHFPECPYMCDICPKKFKTKSQIRAHRLSHDQSRKYKCPKCDKELTTQRGIQLHIRTAHEGFQTLCKICGKSFSSFSSLSAHAIVHTGEQPYECEICHQKFAYAFAFKRHKYTHGKKKRPHQCDMCDKEFVEKASLDKHRRVHTGECPYVCTECGRGFKDRTKLYAHLRVVHKMEFQVNIGRPKISGDNQQQHLIEYA